MTTYTSYNKVISYSKLIFYNTNPSSRGDFLHSLLNCNISCPLEFESTIPHAESQNYRLETSDLLKQNIPTSY